MKIQVLELPMEHVGEVTSTPFVLVLSEIDAETAERIGGRVALIREATGARGVLAFEGPVEI